MQENLLKVEQQLNTSVLFVIFRWTKTAPKIFDVIKLARPIELLVAVNTSMEDKATKCKAPREISKGADYRLSLQAAVWDKQTLLELLREGESAWELELNGTKRTNDLGAPFLSVIGDSPIPYFCTGVVKGKWVKEAVKLCETEGIEVDLTARSMQTPVDRLLRSATAGKLVEFTRERSTIANKFINFVKSRH